MTFKNFLSNNLNNIWKYEDGRVKENYEKGVKLPYLKNSKYYEKIVWLMDFNWASIPNKRLNHFS